MKQFFTSIATNIKFIITASAVTVITGGFFVFNNSEFSEQKFENEEEERGPNPDRPDLALAQDVAKTMDPALGYAPTERLIAVRDYIKQQQANKNFTVQAGVWTERGPSNIGGRTRALMFDPNDINDLTVWAGGVGGGLWYTTDISQVSPAWVKIDDFWANIAVTCIAYDPSNTQIFYVGTGEGFYNSDAIRGNGIWKTTDGGTSWAQISSTTGSTFNYIQDIVVESSGNVYAATRSGGIQRSINGGTSWSQVLSGAAADLEISANGTLFGTIGIFSTGGIYKSTNGTTWTASYTSAADEQRIEVACAPSNSSILYAMVQANTYDLKKIMKSTDGGTVWSSVTLPTWCDQGASDPDMTRGQAWYDLILAVDPNSSSTVFAGGVDVMKSTNSGTAWTQATRWSSFGSCAGVNMHADQHAIVFAPGSSSEMLFGNDGGVYYSVSGGASVNNKNSGYNVTQFYACAMNPTSGSNYFLAGAQDNGTQKFTSPLVNITVQATGGDGAFCFIDQDNPTYQITAYVYNNFYRSTNTGGSWGTLTSDNNGSFINPADYDDANNILYSGYSAGTLFRVTGITSTPASGTITLTGATGTTTHIKVSPNTSTTLFVGTSAGKVYKVTNANGSPTTTDKSTGLPAGSVSCIEVGATDNDLIAVYSNYGVTSVWRSTDGGTSWASREGNLPDMPVRWAMIDPNNSSHVILATEVGVWETADITVSSPTWVAYSDFPSVRTDMLQTRSSDDEVIAATHGRGLFSASTLFVGGSPPVANFSASSTTICAGKNTTFTDASTNSPTAWSWAFQGGTPATSTSQNPVITYNTAGAYSVSLTATNGSGSDNETKLSYITVNAKPTPTITVTPSATVCSGSTITLTASGGTTYSWAPGGNTAVNKVVSNLTATTTYTLTATNANGCTNTTTKTITINSLPNTSINTNPSATICTGTSVTLTGAGATTYSWYGGGQTTASVTKSPTAATTYTVLGTNASGCTKTATKTITVNSLPSTGITASSSTICSGTTITLTGTGATTYSWSGGGQTTASVTKSPTVTTTYTVTGTNASGCTKTATKTITVNSLSVLMSKNDETCATNDGTATATPTGSSPYTYSWSPGGGTTQTIVGLAAGSYTCTVTDNNGCVKVGTVAVGDACGGSAPVADFSGTPTTLCAGGSVAYTDLSTNTPTSWSWTFQGGNPSSSSSQNPSVTYTAAGTYSVSLTATNGIGSDPEDKTGYITVLAPPSVVMSKTDATCTSPNGTATATASGGSSPYTYAWSNGAITSAISGIAAASYTCTVTGSNGCASTKTVSVGSVACGPTQLQAWACGIVVSALNQQLQCVPVTNATQYRYRVTHPPTGFSYTYVRPDNNTQFQMVWVPGIMYGRVYRVEVAALVGGVWSNYGLMCNTGTPATIPLTQIAPPNCGATLAAVSTTIYCNAVLGATEYNYHVVNTGLGFDKYYTRTTPVTDFKLSWISGTLVNTTYTVTVRTNVSGTFSSFGPPCSVTTGPVARIAGEDGELDFSMNIFPNPVSVNELNVLFDNLDVDGEMMIEIYNTMGVKINSIKTEYSHGGVITIPIDDSFSNGVYFINATISDKRVYQRFVVMK